MAALNGDEKCLRARRTNCTSRSNKVTFCVSTDTTCFSDTYSQHQLILIKLSFCSLDSVSTQFVCVFILVMLPIFRFFNFSVQEAFPPKDIWLLFACYLDLIDFLKSLGSSWFECFSSLCINYKFYLLLNMSNYSPKSCISLKIINQLKLCFM